MVQVASLLALEPVVDQAKAMVGAPESFETEDVVIAEMSVAFAGFEVFDYAVRVGLVEERAVVAVVVVAAEYASPSVALAMLAAERSS